MRLSTYSLALVIVLITSGKVFSAESVYHTDAPILESGGPLDPTCENTLRTTRATCSRAKIEEYPRCKHSDPVQERICVADTCMKKKYPSGSATSEAICARGYDMYGGTKNGAAINQGEARPQVNPPPAPAARPTPVAEKTPVTPKKVPTPSSRPAEPKPAEPKAAEPKTAEAKKEAEKREPAKQQQQQQPQQAANTPTQQWPQESAQDIQQCSGLQSKANLCCNQPMRCSSQLTEGQQNDFVAMAQMAKSKGDTAGLEETCRQAKMAGFSSSDVNTGFANICYGNHSACTSTCSAALTKWQSRVNNCGQGCDRNLVNQTIAALDQKRQSCQSYERLESRIRAQSSASAEDAQMAYLCESESSAGQASHDSGGGGSGGGGSRNNSNSSDNGNEWGSLGGGAAAAVQEKPQQTLRDVSPVQQALCTANPNAPGCFDPNSQVEASAGGYDYGTGVTQSEGTSVESAAFNVGSDNNFGPNGSEYNPQGSFVAQPVAGHSIPNGGGGMPGSSGGFGQQQNQGGSDLPAMLGSGVNPNILSEESRGGGGYSPPVGANTDGSGFEFRNRFGGLPSGPGPAGNPGKSFQGMDLKKFLPGGVQDPRRNIAGISDYHPDIGPKHIDFFQRVSTRLQTLCKLKRLLDCN